MIIVRSSDNKENDVMIDKINTINKSLKSIEKDQNINNTKITSIDETLKSILII